MTGVDSWLDPKYDDAEQEFVDGVLGKANGEIKMKILTADASYDAGFEAGVLSAEAGLGRYSD